MQTITHGVQKPPAGQCTEAYLLSWQHSYREVDASVIFGVAAHEHVTIQRITWTKSRLPVSDRATSRYWRRLVRDRRLCALSIAASRESRAARCLGASRTQTFVHMFFGCLAHLSRERALAIELVVVVELELSRALRSARSLEG